MVFPAQSGSTLWPSLCALGTRPTAIPILSLAFPSQSRTVPSPPAPPPQKPFAFFYWLSTQRTSCSSYSEIWERFSILKRLNYCTCDPEQHRDPQPGGTAAVDALLQTWSQFLRAAEGRKAICIFVSFLTIIKDGREASHLFSHETFSFISAVQLVSVPALRLD